MKRGSGRGQSGTYGGDVRRCRATAAAEQVDTELGQPGGVCSQVAGGGVVLKVVAHHLREAGVRLGDQE